MFCPKCRSEYVDGVAECEECKVPLVPELPEQGLPEGIKLVNVFTTNTSFEANFVKSLLESSGIECFVVNEHLVSISIFLSNAIPITVAVEEKNEPQAKRIIEQYFKDLREPGA